MIQAVQEYIQTQMKSIYISLFQNIQFNNLLVPIKTVFNLGWDVREKKRRERVVMGFLTFISLHK